MNVPSATRCVVRRMWNHRHSLRDIASATGLSRHTIREIVTPKIVRQKQRDQKRRNWRRYYAERELRRLTAAMESIREQS